MDALTSNKIISETIERQKVFYDKKYAAWRSLRCVELVWECIGRQIIEALNISEGKRYLFIGSGDGYLTEFIAKVTKARIIGIDVSGVALTICHLRRSEKTDYIFADAQELPFRKDSFDGVIAPAVLHHLPFIGKALTEFYRVVRNGGVVYNLDARDYFLRYPLNFILKRLLSQDEVQLKRKDLITLYGKAGFTIISDVSQSFLMLVFIPFLRRLGRNIPSSLLGPALRIDLALARYLGMRHFSWVVTIVARKGDRN